MVLAIRALAFAFIFVPFTLSAETIKIGEVGSMTGDQATFGISTNKGIKLAVKEQNAKGGIKGRKIEHISLDNQGKLEEAAMTTKKLITQDKVVAVLGEVASSLSLAMAPIAQEYKIPMVSPSSTNPKVTEIGDYIFRVCFIDPFQGSVMAKFANETLKLKKVAVLSDIKNAYSVGLAEYFVAAFKKAGGEIVAEQTYNAGEVDFSSQLTSIKAKKPEAIYVPGYYTEVGLIAKQARQRGIKVPLLGGDGWDSEKLTELGGKSLDNAFFSNHYSPDDKSPAVQDFVANFKKEYKGEVPDGLAAMGYDAAKILFAAMEKTKKMEPKEIRDELAKTKDFPAVTGKITMDDHRNPTKSAVVLEIKDKKYVYKSTVSL